MAEIFISYKSDRRNAAKHLAGILTRYGYSVWYDYGLIKGDDFDFQLDRELRAAKVVIVLWCSMSVESAWVSREAGLAARLKTLLPVVVEPCELKLAHHTADYIDLSRWDGSPRSHTLDPLLREVARLVGRTPQADWTELSKYEEDWRMFGAPSLAAFALGRPLEPVASEPAAGLMTLAAQEWPSVRGSRDISKLQRFEKHFAGTYYADEAREMREALEAIARPPGKPNEESVREERQSIHSQDARDSSGPGPKAPAAPPSAERGLVVPARRALLDRLWKKATSWRSTMPPPKPTAEADEDRSIARLSKRQWWIGTAALAIALFAGSIPGLPIFYLVNTAEPSSLWLSASVTVLQLLSVFVFAGQLVNPLRDRIVLTLSFAAGCLVAAPMASALRPIFVSMYRSRGRNFPVELDYWMSVEPALLLGLAGAALALCYFWHLRWKRSFSLILFFVMAGVARYFLATITDFYTEFVGVPAAVMLPILIALSGLLCLRQYTRNSLLRYLAICLVGIVICTGLVAATLAANRTIDFYRVSYLPELSDDCAFPLMLFVLPILVAWVALRFASNKEK